MKLFDNMFKFDTLCIYMAKNSLKWSYNVIYERHSFRNRVYVPSGILRYSRRVFPSDLSNAILFLTTTACSGSSIFCIVSFAVLAIVSRDLSAV